MKIILVELLARLLALTIMCALVASILMVTLQGESTSQTLISHTHGYSERLTINAVSVRIIASLTHCRFVFARPAAARTCGCCG